eukprot:scaffold3504_cov240-Pinguiococcus_pyrenoidosus.AAC.56
MKRIGQAARPRVDAGPAELRRVPSDVSREGLAHAARAAEGRHAQHPSVPAHAEAGVLLCCATGHLHRSDARRLRAEHQGHAGAVLIQDAPVVHLRRPLARESPRALRSAAAELLREDLPSQQQPHHPRRALHPAASGLLQHALRDLQGGPRDGGLRLQHIGGPRQPPSALQRILPATHGVVLNPGSPCAAPVGIDRALVGAADDSPDQRNARPVEYLRSLDEHREQRHLERGQCQQVRIAGAHHRGVLRELRRVGRGRVRRQAGAPEGE